MPTAGGFMDASFLGISADQWVAIFTAVLALFTAVLAICTEPLAKRGGEVQPQRSPPLPYDVTP